VTHRNKLQEIKTSSCRDA